MGRKAPSRVRIPPSPLAATLDRRRSAPVAQLDRASVYGTEGQRFESSRARSVAAFSPRLSVGIAPKVNSWMPRHVGPEWHPPIFWRLFWRPQLGRTSG